MTTTTTLHLKKDNSTLELLKTLHEQNQIIIQELKNLKSSIRNQKEEKKIIKNELTDEEFKQTIKFKNFTAIYNQFKDCDDFQTKGFYTLTKYLLMKVPTDKHRQVLIDYLKLILTEDEFNIFIKSHQKTATKFLKLNRVKS